MNVRETDAIPSLTVTVTGMTRDGTFLIQGGEITTPVQNLRFTQSYLEALRQTQMISRETKLDHQGYSYNRVPALKIGSFNFTSATEY